MRNFDSQYIDEYLDAFGDDLEFFHRLKRIFVEFETIEETATTLAFSSGDVIVVADLYNDKAKYELKCYVGKQQTEYRFNDISKLPEKLKKLQLFIRNHSMCRF
jgi:hypothetical protein